MYSIFKIWFLLFLFVLFSHFTYGQQWSVQHCLDYAANHNPALKSEEQKATAAALKKESASSQLFPQINGKASLDYYWQIPVEVFPGELLGQPGKYIPVKMGTPWMGNVGVTASWDIINPAQWEKIKLAKLEQQMANSSVKSLLQRLFMNVRITYYQTQLLQENILIAKQRLEDYKNVHSLIEQKLNQGLIDKITFNQSLSILKNLEQDKLTLEAQTNQSLLSLKFWMGFPLNDSLNILSGIDESPVPLSFHPQALPDYSQETLKLQLASSQYNASKAVYYPSISIASGYSKLGFGQDFNFIAQSKWFTSGYVGMELDVPILAIGKMFYEPKRQKVLLASAKDDFINYEQMQEKEFMEEKIAWEEAVKEVSLQKEQLELAENNVRLSYQKIEKGIINMIQMKEVQRDLDEARQSLNQANLEVIRHAVMLQYLQSNTDTSNN